MGTAVSPARLPTLLPASGGGLGWGRFSVSVGGLKPRLRERDALARRLDRRIHRAQQFRQPGAGDAGHGHDRCALRGPLQRLQLFRHLGRIDRVDLVEADDFRLVGKAGAIPGELGADRAVGGDGVVLGAVDQVQDHGAALDMAEKAGTEPGAVARAFDEAGEVGEDEFGVVAEPDDAELRVERGERIVGDLRPRVRDARKEGRLAGVGEADEPGIGDQLEAQPYPELAARPAGAEAARGLVGRGLVVEVAEPAVAAGQQDDALVRLGHVGEDGFLVVVEDFGADGHAQDDVLAVGAGALAAGAAAAVLGAEMLLVAVVDQRVEVFLRLKDDVAAPAAVAAVGTAELDEFLAAKAHRAAPAVAALQVDLALVEKFHRC